MSWIGAATDVPPSGTEKVVAFVRDNALTLVAVVVSLVAGVVSNTPGSPRESAQRSPSEDCSGKAEH